MQDLSTLVRETSSQPDASLRLCKLSNRVEALQEFIDNPVEWVPRDARDALEKKVKHQIWRSQLASHRLLRVIPVLVSLMTGRYSRYGRGLADALADF